MKGLIAKAVTGLCLGGSLSGLVGCTCYRDVVDPCWPERYNHMARQSVNYAFGNQVANGHVLDQTVWNWQFETDPKTGAPTDRLSPAGVEHLTYLARRRPCPDTKVYLQSAGDLTYSQDAPTDKYAEMRSDLDNRRAAVVQKYLTALTANRPLTTGWDVQIHDAPTAGFNAEPINGTMTNIQIQGAVPSAWSTFGQPKTQIIRNAGGGGGS